MCAAREAFKYLLMGMLSEIKRKTLPAIAKAVGADAQALHHVVAYAPWSVEELRKRRLTFVQQATADQARPPITWPINTLGTWASSRMAWCPSTPMASWIRSPFPCCSRSQKPRTRLKPGATYKTKPTLAVELIRELQQWGFRFEVVLADSLYGESSNFVSELEKLHLKYVVAIRSNHGVWLPPGQRVRSTNWRPFERLFSNGDSQTRFIRELIFGQRGHIRYYHLTTDKEKLPPESTWYIRTNLEGTIRTTVGNTSGLRTWIEYGFKNATNELSWADFRVTDSASIEHWWELVCCAYLLVSLQSPVFGQDNDASGRSQPATVTAPPERFAEHRWWDSGQGWKNILNNLRLVLQPYIFHCLLLLSDN
jgi:SRSO17 transposase